MTIGGKTLLEQFEAQEIDNTTFGHAAHVEVAYELLRRDGFVGALKVYADCLNVMATKAGAPEKFNLTITVAFLSLIAERMAEGRAGDFDEFADANPDVMSSQAITDRYSRLRINSDLARSVFLMPDKSVA